MSALTNLNASVFAEGGAQFTTFGVEYWSNPDNRGEGYIEWVADQPVFRVDNNVFSGDPSLNISSRLISEEPMALVLNLAISGTHAAIDVLSSHHGVSDADADEYPSMSAESFQTVDLAAMTFPAEMRVDYIRVWQRKGLSNAVGCDPPSKP